MVVLITLRGRDTIRQACRAWDPRRLVSVVDFAIGCATLGVDIQRLLKALVRLVVVIEHVLQIFLLHLLLVGDWLEHALIVLWRTEVDEHRSIDRRIVQGRWLLARVISAAHRALLRPSDARRNDQVEAELARLHLFLMQVA